MAAPQFLHFPGREGAGRGRTVVLIAGDDEYRSEESMPMLGKILSQRHGFDCTVLFPAGADGLIEPCNHRLLSHPAALDEADAIVMCIRFRDWEPEAFQHFEAACLRGVPIVALRTSTHAFAVTRPEAENPWRKWNWNSEDAEWTGGFGKQVLGETWVDHHGTHGVEGCRGVIEEANRDHEILNGVRDVFVMSDVYTARPPEDATILVRGQVTASLDPASRAVAGEKNDPMQPVAWTRERGNEAGTVNRIVTTTMGAAIDLQNEGLRRLVVNSVFWGLGIPVPSMADVRPVDPYDPPMYGLDTVRNDLRVGDLDLGKALPPGHGDGR